MQYTQVVYIYPYIHIVHVIYVIYTRVYGASVYWCCIQFLFLFFTTNIMLVFIYHQQNNFIKISESDILSSIWLGPQPYLLFSMILLLVVFPSIACLQYSRNDMRQVIIMVLSMCNIQIYYYIKGAYLSNHSITYGPFYGIFEMSFLYLDCQKGPLDGR